MMNTEAPGGIMGQLPGKSGGHGWSSAREFRGLSDIFAKTGDVSLVSRIGAKNAHTFEEEFGKRHPTISYKYTIQEREGRKRWISEDGKTLNELFKKGEVGGDRLQRFLQAEDRMLSDRTISQVAVASEDLGVGLNRHYVYWMRKDEVDPTTVHATAIEFQGNNQEFLTFMNKLDGAHRTQGERISSFERPLFFNDRERLNIEDIHRSVIQSYANQDRRREMGGYIQRLTRDAVNFDRVKKEREEEVDHISIIVEDKLTSLLKETDVKTGLGMMAQALPEIVKQLDKSMQIHSSRNARVSLLQPVMSKTHRDSSHSYTNVPQIYRRREKPYKFRFGKSEGFRSGRWRSEATQTGGIKIIPAWRRRLKVDEVGEEMLAKVKNKVKGKQDQLHYHDSISLASIFISNKSNKRPENRRRALFVRERTKAEQRSKRKRESVRDSPKLSQDKRILMNIRPLEYVQSKLNRLIGKKQVFGGRERILFDRRVVNSRPLKDANGRVEPFEKLLKRRKIRKASLEKVQISIKEMKIWAKKEKRIILKPVEKWRRQFREKNNIKEFILKPREYIKKVFKQFKKEILQKRRKYSRERRKYKKFLRFMEFVRRVSGKDSIIKVNRESLRMKIKRGRFLRKLILQFYRKDSRQYRDFRRGNISRRTLLRIEGFVRRRIARIEQIRLYERIFGRKIFRIIRLLENRYKKPRADIKTLGSLKLAYRSAEWTGKSVVTFQENLKKFLRASKERVNLLWINRFVYQYKPMLLDFWIIFQLKRELKELLLSIDKYLVDDSISVQQKNNTQAFKLKRKTLEYLSAANNGKQFPRKGVIFSYKPFRTSFVSL